MGKIRISVPYGNLGFPYWMCKKLISFNIYLSQSMSQRSLVKRLRLPSLNYFKKENKDGVFKMSLSPSGTYLAVVHLSGKFSLWNMPSLKLMKMWDHSEQVRFVPHREKTCLWGFPPGLTQTRLHSHRRWTGAWNLGFRKKRDCTIYVAIRKALISCAVTAQLTCTFVFAYAKSRFSHDATHSSNLIELCLIAVYYIKVFLYYIIRVLFKM